MAVVAAPWLWAIAVEAAEAAVAILGATVAVVAVDEAVEAIDEALEERAKEKARTLDEAVDETCVKSCGQKKCPPCVPPVGSIRVKRIDLVPPGRHHADCPGDHAHLVQRNQSPYPECDCYWNKPRPDYVCLEPGESPPYPML